METVSASPTATPPEETETGSGYILALNTDVDGSSEDSRVNFGTLGHHHVWADAPPTTIENSSDDRERWRFQTEEEGLEPSSPTIVNGTLYIGRQDGNVYALDAASGNEKWRFGTGESVRSAPTMVNGTVFVGNDGGTIYAIDATTGEEVWNVPTPDTIWPSPTVADNTVVVGNHSGDIYAVDATTGTEQWHRETDGPVFSSPTIVEGTVFIASTFEEESDDPALVRRGMVYALDLTNGESKWEYKTQQPIQSSPTVSDGTVFIGSENGTLYAFTQDTGDVEWTFEKSDGSIGSSPTVSDGTVFVGMEGGDGRLYALDRDTGEVEWQFDARRSVFSSPTLADGTVFVGSGDHHVYAIDAATGNEKWRFETIGRVLSSPTVVSGVLFVGTGKPSPSPVTTGVEPTVEPTRDGETPTSIPETTTPRGSESDGAGADQTTASETVPGFGIIGSLAALGGVGYLLKDTFGDDE